MDLPLNRFHLQRLIASVGLAVMIFIGQTGCGDRTPKEELILGGKYQGYNLVILVLDTLRSDHLGCYGYFRDTSPEIDRLSRQAVLFNNAFASIPITLPSHVSILTGLYPQTAGILYNYGRLSDKTVTMAEILRQAGYRTSAVVSTAVLKRSKNLNQGFDEYYQNFGIEEMRGKTGWEVKGIAEDANQLALGWLKKIKKDEKFFLFINYYDIHAPYIEHEPFQDIFNPESPEFISYLKLEWTALPEPAWKRKIITYYDRSIAYTDHCVGRLWNKLDDLGLRDNTIVIITSDHGNGLYQHHDYWSHGEYLYDEQIKIPLILVLPDRDDRLEVNRLVETVDLLPTVLDLLGVDIQAEIDGKSMCPLMESGEWSKPDRAYAMRKPDDNSGNMLPRQFCVRTPENKLISTFGGEKEFYNLDRDPFEKENIYSLTEKQRGKFISGLLSQGETWFDLKNVEDIIPGAPDPETLKELKSLGYIR